MTVESSRSHTCCCRYHTGPPWPIEFETLIYGTLLYSTTTRVSYIWKHQEQHQHQSQRHQNQYEHIKPNTKRCLCCVILVFGKQVLDDIIWSNHRLTSFDINYSFWGELLLLSCTALIHRNFKIHPEGGRGLLREPYTARQYRIPQCRRKQSFPHYTEPL